MSDSENKSIPVLRKEMRVNRSANFIASIPKFKCGVLALLLTSCLLIGSSGNSLAQAYLDNTTLVLDERDPEQIVSSSKTPLILIHGMHGNKTDKDGNCGPYYDETQDDLSHLCKSYWLNFTNYFYSSQLKDSYQLYRFHYISDKISVDEISWGLQFHTGLVFGSSRPLVLVAHSMGGLVARSFISNHGGGGRVKGCITLATPHRGSPVANSRARTHISNASWVGFMKFADAIYWKNFALTFLTTEPNRADLRWDNFDGQMSGVCMDGLVPLRCYDDDPSERNDWLRNLNQSDTNLRKFLLYVGFIQQDDPQRVAMLSDIAKPYINKEVYLGAYANSGSRHEKLRVANILMNEGMGGFYAMNDGMVPYDSARMSGAIVGKRRYYSGYDHVDMVDGKYESGGFPLFDQLKSDLLDVASAPSVSVVLPTNASSVRDTVEVTTLSSNDTVKVEFYINRVLKYTSVGTPFSWVWCTSGYSNGQYSLQVKAYDVADNVGVSPSITVFVDNLGGNNSPNMPSGLAQSKSNGSTTIGIGGSTDERTVVMKGDVSDPNSDSVTLDIEVKSIGTAFQNTPSAACKSGSFTPSGSVAVNTCSGMTDGHYHWQARARDSKGAASAWLPAGWNAESADDFVVAAGSVPVNLPPNVTIVSPNGGEALVTGSVHTVRWSATDDHGVQGVSIWYSTDGGLNSSPVALGLTNSGSYSWTDTGTLTNNGRILIIATDGSLSSVDWSDAPFSVVQNCALPGTPSLIDPGIYSETGNFTINWAAVNASSYVLQEATDASFSSSIPYVAAGTSKYIAGKGNGFYYYRLAGVNACGQGPFSNVVDIEVRIPAPPGQASNPNPSNGQVNVQRQGLNLSWSPGIGSSEMGLYFGRTYDDLGYRGLVSGSSYNISEDLEAGTTYYWKIRAHASNDLVSDSPVWSFTTEYTIADLTPIDLTIEGTLGPGNPLTLKATIRNIGTFSSGDARVYLYYSATPGAKDKLLNQNGTDIPLLAQGAEAQISVPVTLDRMIAGQSYFVAWVDTHYFSDGNIDNNTYSKSVIYTDGNAPEITSLWLPAYTFYKTGFKYNIFFSAKDDTGITNIDLAYSPDGGSTWQDVVRGFVPTGSIQSGNSYEWTVPASCPLTSNLLVKLTARDTSGNSSSRTAGPYVVRDGSAPLPTIVSPNGGEIWGMGTAQDIRWTLSSRNPIRRIVLDFFAGAVSYEVASLEADPGVLRWTFPNNCATSTGRIRIVVEDINGNLAEDWSDGFFQILDTSLPPSPPWNILELVDSTPGIPSIAVDTSGTVHAAYLEKMEENVSGYTRTTQNIHYRKRIAGTWSARQTIYTLVRTEYSEIEGIPDLRELKLVLDASQRPHIVWVIGSTGDTQAAYNESDVFHMHFDGTSWSSPTNISSALRGEITVPRAAWTNRAAMPVAKSDAASAVYDGSLYVFGGSQRLTNYRYNPSSNEWTPLADSAGWGVSDGGAAVIGNRIYVFGDAGGFRELKAYDPAANQWAGLAPLPVSRRFPGVVSASGMLYLIGGASGGPTDSVYAYDPALNEWSQRNPMPTPRYGLVAAVVNGLIYAIGGRGIDGCPTQTIECYDPAANTWTSLPNRGSGNWPEIGFASAAVIGDYIVVIGGERHWSELESQAVNAFDTRSQVWLPLSSLPYGVSHAMAGAVGSKIYLVGGRSAGSDVSTLLEGTFTTEWVGTYSGPPDVTMDPQSNLHVVWQDGGYYEGDSNSSTGFSFRGTSGLRHKTRSSGGTWSVITNVEEEGGSAPAIAADNHGGLHLAYVQSGSLWYRIWNGVTWSPRERISDRAGGDAAEIAVGTDDRPRVVWRYCDRPQDKDLIYLSQRGTGGWTLPESVGYGFNFNPPLLALDFLNRPHLAYEVRDWPGGLYYRYVGAAVSSPIILHYVIQRPFGLSSRLVVSPLADHLHAIWSSSDGILYNHAAVSTATDLVPPSINILWPEAGGVVSNGSDVDVRWQVSDDSTIAFVRLEYSVDGSVSFASLNTSAPNTGRYSWRTPIVETDAAVVRITAIDPSGNAGIGTSGAFTIRDNKPPQASLLSPSGGERWDAGSQHDISWSATDNTGVASVALYFSVDDGTSWQSIATGLAGIGTYGWSIPYVYSTMVRVKAVAYDAGGLASETASPALTIVRPNTAPVTPYSPLPADNQTDVALDATIRWSSGDLDGDALTYTIFFGSDSNPPQVATGVSSTSYSPPTLIEKTAYYWRIVASDGKASAVGPIWKFTTGTKPINAPTSLSAAVKSATQINLSWNDNSDNEEGFSIERKIAPYGLYQVVASIGQNVNSFIDTAARGNTTYVYRVRAYNAATYSGYSPEVSGTTMNTPPDQPSNPTPADTSSNQVQRAILRWVGSDADLGDTLTYDVYFGRSTNAHLISERQQDKQLPLGTLDPNSVYYWRVVAFDNHGDSAAGSWWTFVTGDQSPIINLDPIQLTFSSARGGGVTGPQEMKITNSGGCVMQWELRADAGWLKSSSLAGFGDETVQITADTAGLDTGTYQGNLTILAEGADNTPQVVPVALNITDPVLSVTSRPDIGGVVTAEGISCPGTCSASFPDDTPIAHLTATPAAGYYLLRWEGDASGSSAVLELAMNGNKQVTAIFAISVIYLPKVKNDFDGDGRSDIGCYYPTGGNWYEFRSKDGFWQTQFGYAGTVPITGDFDGDGKADIGCYYATSGNWYVYKSSEGFWQTTFGYAGTIPIVGDFDGDGKDDIGCYYPAGGNWYVYKSTEGFWQTTFGYAGTIPIVGDFDGDGRDDIGCYYATGGNWYVYKSSEGFWQTTFGYAGTIPVVGDFDGDGKDDIGCYYPAGGNWYVFKSTEGFWQTTFGYSGTEPVVGDFDGDGRDDIGCYYPTGGNWYLYKSTDGFWQTQFGYSGTTPLGGTLR